MSISGLTLEDLKKLSEAFPKDKVGVKVQSISKSKDRALLVLYLQHTDVSDRLNQIDLNWIFTILSEERYDGVVYTRARLTLKGVTRENVGEGDDPKASCSDALKRCAMLFGVGKYLYDQPQVWVPYNEAKDRFKQWSWEDYEGKPKPTPEPTKGTLVKDLGRPPAAIPDAGSVTVPFGKNAGKMIKEMSIPSLEADLAYWETRIKKDAKPATGPLKLYLDSVNAYLDQQQGSSPLLKATNDEMGSQEDIPW